MTHFLDYAIETLTISPALILAVQFACYAWQQATTQTSKAVLSTELPSTQPQPKGEDRIVSFIRKAKPKISDTIIPFHRPQHHYSNLALIRLAKSLAKQGHYSKAALKWSFSRKLSDPVRTELLQLAQAI